MIGSKFDEAVRNRNYEIDDVAAEFVRDGFSPWEAMRRAVEHVDMQRRRAAIDRSSNSFAEAIRKGRFG